MVEQTASGSATPQMTPVFPNQKGPSPPQDPRLWELYRSLQLPGMTHHNIIQQMMLQTQTDGEMNMVIELAAEMVRKGTWKGKTKGKGGGPTESTM